MFTLLVAQILSVLIPILMSWRLVTRAERVCGRTLARAENDRSYMQHCCELRTKDQEAHLTSLSKRYEMLSIQLTQATDRITKLERTRDVKAKAGAANAIQELVNR